MRILTISLLTVSIFFHSCDVFRKSEKSSAKQKGIDQTTLKPVEYSSGDRNLDYVTKFNRAATLNMERIGVPASITLAQGILESAGGTSDLATVANNHFGIKCGGSWNGKTFYKMDDDKDASGKPKESCFRKYESVEESFLDHGEFLRDPKKSTRYGYLFNLDKTDYKSWARGLQSAGYATAPDYADKLINLIERYKLYEYDQPGAKPSPTFPGTPGGGENGGVKPQGPNAPGTPSTSSGRIARVNDVKVVVSREGETLEDVARAFRLNTQKVVDYNDRGYPPGVVLKPNTRIFIQSKKDQWSGRATEHTVREGQTMFDIAQVYGIKLEKLLARNGLMRGQEPEVNERVRLKRSRSPLKPIKLRDTSNDPKQPTAPGSSTSKPKKEDTMVNDDELDFEISPGDPKPKTDKPNSSGNNTQPSWPGSKPPATTDEPMPGDPKPKTDTGAKPTPPVKEEPVPPGYHRVVKGDTLYKLSRDYNTTVSRIKQLNKMTSDDIKIGQLLRVE
ncbi:MAG: LysM peptidoglycan-binding domain-containing protein [Saprospiraceae bacterium]|nr:LysM peptidoglycan-binding domain-containing protein [Saprospiraceae bacterium]